MRSTVTFLSTASAVLGGLVLTLLALAMTLSICGGALAKLAYSDWLVGLAPGAAAALQGTGVRTIPGLYEVMEMGIAFTIFACLPIAQLRRSHAVVDVFTDALPRAASRWLEAFWEVAFCLALLLIAWRLYFGLERLMQTGVVHQELGVPEWWGYAVALAQMALASLVGVYTAGERIAVALGRPGTDPVA